MSDFTNLKYKEFLLRRLHSLTGMAPMGVFLFEHFFTNSYAYQGEAVYNEKVEFLRTLPYLYFIEWGLLFGPFLFHILYGIKIMYSGEYVIRKVHNNRKWMYWLQRVTAIPALMFIAWHLATTRFAGYGEDANFYRVMVDEFKNPAIVLFYIVGILSICFHFANGIATFCMTWGITVSPGSQKLVGLASAGVGVALAGMAINSIFGFNDAGLGKAAEEAVKEAPHAAMMIFETIRQAIC